jgi:hypothetical protein
MASHIEMKRLADNPGEAGRLATFLLTLPDAEWTAWEINFLEGLVDRTSKEPLSLRQCEKLFELKDAGVSFRVYDGFSVATLLRQSHEARFDLDDDDDIEFLERLKAEQPASLKRRPLTRLVRCARQLDIIHDYAETG